MTRWPIAVLAVAAAAAVAVIALAGGDDESPRAERPPAETPRAGPPKDQVAAHLAALQRIADEHGDTRAAGTPGDRATSEYLAERLRPLGYRVTTQDFRVPFYRERRPPRLVAGGRRVEDIRAFQFSASGQVSGRVREIPALGCDASDRD